MFLWNFCNDFCRPRRIAVQQRLKLAAREVEECIRYQGGDYIVRWVDWVRMEPDRETKMRFVTIIQPLTLFPTFSDAQASYFRGIPMVVFARASRGGLPAAGIAS